MKNKIRVAVIGMGFGKQFLPIYQAHPDSSLEAICAAQPEVVEQLGEQYGISKRYTEFQQVLDDPQIDAVHIVTPCEEHAWMSIAAMKAGKHVSCTVPIGMSLDEIMSVVVAQKETSKTFMMMETAIYTREYLYIKGLRDSGTLGRIQFVRGAHLQDMSMAGWSKFWNGLPPMWYATHCLGPCLEIVNTGGLAESVVCHGSGRIRSDYIPAYGSPFSFETAHVRVKDSDVVAEVSRFVHGVTRQYCETLDVYGSQTSIEWRRRSDDDLFLFDGGENAKTTAPPDVITGLPAEIARFARRDVVTDQQHASFIQGGGHGGSYPHLVHEYISAIRDNRNPTIDIVKAANWSAVGFCAHDSAMAGGQKIMIPDYSLS